MNRQIITHDGKPAFVVIPIHEWRLIEARLQDRADVRAVRHFRESPSETFPDSIAAALLAGSRPIKVFREHRRLTQAALANAVGTSAVYISQLERGIRRAGRKLQGRLAGALAIDVELLDSGDD